MSGDVEKMWTPEDGDLCTCGRNRAAGVHADGALNGHAFELWVPSRTGDNADTEPRVIANHLRTLTREMRDGFESIGRALTALTRIEERLIVVIDRQNVLERRLDDHDRRLTALEKRRSSPRKKR